MTIKRLRPRLVVVTGAGSGIGRATAMRFAKLGAHVVVSDIDLDAASATRAMIRGNGHRASAERLDVTDPDNWEALAEGVRAEHGYTDVLVNNAGLLVCGPFLELGPADWDRQLGVNLMGVVHGSRVFGAQMVDQRRGHIVNIASAAAFTPTAVMAPYSVSKAGVKMLTECLRLEFGPKGVGVSAICPGVINTNIGEHAVTVGIDRQLIERGRQMNRWLDEFAEKLPFSPMSPDLVARAAVRAVRFDLAVVPVRAEAWLGYFMLRAAPGLNRRMMQPLSVETLEKLGSLVVDRLGRSKLPLADADRTDLDVPIVQ